MEKIKLNDILEYKYISAPEYAPDGKRAAFVVCTANEEDNNYEGRLWLYDGAVRQLTDLGKERSFIWEDATHLLFPAVRSGKEKKRAEAGEQFTSYYRLDVNGGEAVHAFTLPFGVSWLKQIDGNLWAAMGSIDANVADYYKMSEEDRKKADQAVKDDKDYEVFDESPFWLNNAGIINKSRTALFLIHMDTMEIKRITEPTFDVEDLEVFGKEIYFAGQAYSAKPVRRQFNLFCLNAETEEIRTVCDKLDLYGNGMDKVGDRLILKATDGEHHGINENSWVYEVNKTTGELTVLRKEACSMYSSVGSDCRYGGGASTHVKGDRLYYTPTVEGDSHLYALEADGSVTKFLEKAGSVDAFTVNENSDKAILVGMYDNKLQEVYSFDLNTKELVQLTHMNEKALEGRYVAEPQPLKIQSQGYEIGGWVLLPKDYDPEKKYPAILDIHGGPKTVYGPVFYHEMQLWANMGYFVFFCNPKGSDGRDNEFMDIRGHYGDTDFKNLMDFTDAVLAKYPQIDQKHVCVTGGSYGGFMTNWVIGHTHRFCCAASQRSISNWLSFYGISDIGPYFATDQTDADPFENHDKMWAQSPMKYTGDVTTPTLFIHSDEDYRCPMSQGIQMYTCLVENGIPARLCLFHGENHELSRSGKPKHRIRRLTEMTNWFEKYAKEN